MTLLLDTHILLWAIYQPARIPENWVARLVDRNNPVFFSAASIWQIAIKSSLERPDFVHDAERTLQLARQTGFVELPVSGEVAARVRDLPWHHRDPFDRLLIAQAKQMPARLLTADSQLPIYSELVELIA
ncbi:MAG: type II toxin-antitoxin system VapC family toxin [Azonexus sp.]|nr:type II toxin-antitoxin system VapC family toxin [Azonexus sp.]